MRRHRSQSRALLLALAGVGVLACPAAAQDGGPGPAVRLERAVVEGDLASAEKALSDLWDADRDKAKEMAWTLLTRGAEDQRPIASASFAAHASAEEIQQVVGALNQNRFQDARVLLARSLGDRSGAEAIDAAMQLAQDRDALVRAAAYRSLADLGHVPSVELYVRKMQAPPSETLRYRGDDGDIEQMAMYGAFKALTGQRPLSNGEAIQWVKNNRRRLGQLKPPKPSDPATDWVYGHVSSTRGRAGQGGDAATLETPSFKVIFDMGTRVKPNMADQEFDLSELSKNLESCAEAATRAAEPIFGKANLPPIRLTLATEQTIAKSGGPSRGYAGFASGNKIVVRFDNWPVLKATLTHEYVHIIHQSHYEDQPRWLAEGIAESLFKSAQRTSWPGADAQSVARLGDELNRGLVSEVLKWDVSGSTNEDPNLYARAHAVVDYLRFGPFPAADARLAELMGRLSRSEHPRRAIEALYGPLHELDAGIRAWVRGEG